MAEGMYIYTIVGAGSLGLGILIAPAFTQSAFGLPPQEPIISYGVTGSAYLAFGLVSVLGLRAPLRYSPVLLLQLCYKSVWFIAIIIPALTRGTLPGYAVLPVAIYASYIIGDLIALPFPYLFAGAAGQNLAEVELTEG